MSGPRRRKFVGPIVSRITWHGGRGTPYLRRWAVIIALARLEGAGLVERHDGLNASAERRPAAGDARGLDGFQQLALRGPVLDGPAHVGDHALQPAAEGEDADDDHLAVLHRQLLALPGRERAERL